MSDKLSVTDHRTGQTCELPIVDGTVNAMDLRPLKASEDDEGLMTYDPGLRNTASCRSRITYINGQQGILRYRGYPVEQLASRGSHLETAYLLIHGELPTRSQQEHWIAQIRDHSRLPETATAFVRTFANDAHPMGILISTVAALSTLYPEAKQVTDHESIERQTYRLIGMMPTIATCLLRHRLGMPEVGPDAALSYTGNLLKANWLVAEERATVPPAMERALDVISCCTPTSSRIAAPT